MAGRFVSPDGAPQGLSQLIDDLEDDDLRQLLAQGWARRQAYLAALLEACDLPRLSDPAIDLVVRDLDTLMEMWT